VDPDPDSDPQHCLRELCKMPPEVKPKGVGRRRSCFDTDLRSGLSELSGLGMEAEDPRPLIP
jgi:hypothetical protein